MKMETFHGYLAAKRPSWHETVIQSYGRFPDIRPLHCEAAHGTKGEFAAAHQVDSFLVVTGTTCGESCLAKRDFRARGVSVDQMNCGHP
jgi:hypothetical protein